jgi:hypothetical protein
VLHRTGIVLASLSLLAAPAALAATKPSPVKKSAAYAGTTSQGSVCRDAQGDEGVPCTVAFKTSKDRKRVKTLTIRWRAGPCSDNSSRYYRGATDFKGLPISSKHRFKFSGSYAAMLDGGDTGTNTVTLNGKFTRTSSGKYRASGDFSVVSDLTLANGTKTHCESGRVTWSAKPTG